jgi:5-methylcytosine-specific restriction endonuclease McrA
MTKLVPVRPHYRRVRSRSRGGCGGGLMVSVVGACGIILLVYFVYSYPLISILILSFLIAIGIFVAVLRWNGRRKLEPTWAVATQRQAVAAEQQRQGRDTRYISQQVRSEVWNRDGGKCVECGSTFYLEYDHIIPLSRGGATSANNLQLLCRGCNSRKSHHI